MRKFFVLRRKLSKCLKVSLHAWAWVQVSFFAHYIMKFASYSGNSMAASRMWTIPDFSSTYVPKGSTQVAFCVSRDRVYMCVYVYIYIYIYIYGEMYVYIQRSEADFLTYNRVGRSLTAPSTVLWPSSFFRHHHETGCPFPQWKIRPAFQKLLFYLCFFFNCASPKLRNLKLRKS